LSRPGLAPGTEYNRCDLRAMTPSQGDLDFYWDHEGVDLQYKRRTSSMALCNANGFHTSRGHNMWLGDRCAFLAIILTGPGY